MLLVAGLPRSTPAIAQSASTIAGISCDAGSRCRTHLTVPALGADTAVLLPVTVLRGTRPGPTL
ncbi:MAG TPA: hypothetical protein PLX31_19555, partial [Gemmatimonadaceae bacterium]|nr:hypothetical protein [Gemmatimonadaceae bacterium]